MKKSVLRFGLYGAALLSILAILPWFLEGHLSYSIREVLGYASIVVSLSFVFFGIKHFRDVQNNGKVSFGKALKIGVLISLFASVAFGILTVIYMTWVNPDFTAEYYGESIEQMRQALPADEFETKVEELEAAREMFSNPGFSFLLMALTVFIIGFIISLISSLILQRKN